MKIEEVQERLKEVGIPIPVGTLRRWAAEGLIERPEREPSQQKRGRVWPEKTVEDAVATWMTRYSDPVWGPPSKDHLLKIKHAAEELQETPWKQCRIGLLSEPDGGSEAHVFEEKPYSPYVTEETAEDLKYIAFTPHQLVSKWLAAVERVRHNSPLFNIVVVIYDWTIDGPRNSRGELYDDNAFEYQFNRVVFEEFLSSKVKGRQWKPGQYWSGRDKVYIFFRSPDFDEDPLNLVRLR